MEQLNKMRIQTMIFYGGGLVLVVLGVLLFMVFSPIGMVLFFVGVFILIICGFTIHAKYKTRFKELICKEVLKNLFVLKEYRPKEGFSKEFVKQTYLIPIGNRYQSDDYVCGSYKECLFERSDVCMQNVTSNGKTTTTVTYFQGTWTVFTFPKKISSYLMIREKEFLSGGRPGGIFTNAPYTEKVKFEDIVFNDCFDVYAEDEHDAFYVLTPKFIEKIKEIENRYEGRLTIGIVDQKLHVLFDIRKNTLEPSIFRQITEEDYQIIENELVQIIEIINSLELI